MSGQYRGRVTGFRSSDTAVVLLQVQLSAENDKLTQVLQRLVDEHGLYAVIALIIPHLQTVDTHKFGRFLCCHNGLWCCAAPMLDALAAGFRECKMKPIVGPKLQLDNFLDSMLRRW